LKDETSSKFWEVAVSGKTVTAALRQAARSALARNLGKARAVDVNTGQIIDFEQA